LEIAASSSTTKFVDNQTEDRYETYFRDNGRDRDGIAVNVRFHEGYDGRDVL